MVSARVEIQAGTNSVTLVQPKDTTVHRLEFNPKTGALVLEDYASAANPAAIEAARAQSAAQAQAWAQTIQMLQWAMKAAAKSQGVTIEDPAPIAVPRGMKLVPIDDPSSPTLEIQAPPLRLDTP